MKKITVTLDENTAASIRRLAARQNMSVSRLVGQVLSERFQESRQYEVAMCRYLLKKPVKLKRAGKRYADRDRLHDRIGLSFRN